MRLRFGLGAWSNAHFDNALYPLGTRHAERLPRYASLFDCAEADVLHHVMPASGPSGPEAQDAPQGGLRRGPQAGPSGPEAQDAPQGGLDLRAWVAETPDGFAFLPKMHKDATHGDPSRAPAVAEAFLAGLEPLRKAGRLGPVLLQFPPGLDRAAGWDLLVSLLATAGEGTFAVEVRSPTWFVPALRELLEDFDAPLVWSTHPAAFAPPWATASRGYVRFTGRHAHSRGRHVTVADRLDDVLEVRKRLRQAPWREAFVIVTNPFEGNAVDSLPRIAAALGDGQLALRLARPPGQPLFPGSAGGGAALS